MSVNSKMTAIADPIRSLLGLSGTMGMDAMAENLVEANTAVNGQTGLIQQIISALEGKVAGGGVNIVAGTYTPASTQTSRVTVTHNLGTEPTGVIFAKQTSQINTNDTILFLWLTGKTAFRAQYYNGSFASSSVSVSGANTQVHAQNHSNADIGCGLTATTFKTPKNLYAGTYVWVVFGEVLK